MILWTRKGRITEVLLNAEYRLQRLLKHNLPSLLIVNNCFVNTWHCQHLTQKWKQLFLANHITLVVMNKSYPSSPPPPSLSLSLSLTHTYTHTHTRTHKYAYIRKTDEPKKTSDRLKQKSFPQNCKKPHCQSTNQSPTHWTKHGTKPQHVHSINQCYK